MPKYKVRIPFAVFAAATLALAAPRAEAGIDFRPASPLPVPARPIYMSAGDLNKDGLADLFVVSPASKTLAVYLADNSAAYFGPAVTYPLESDNARAPALGDINLDGALDVAVPVVNEGKIRLFLGHNDGTLTRRTPDASGFASPTAVAIADVVATGQSGTTRLNYLWVTERGGSVNLTLINPTNFTRNRQSCETSQSGTPCVTGPRPDDIWVVDLNKDAKPDFITLDVGGSRVKSLSVALGSRVEPVSSKYLFGPVKQYVFGDNPSSPIVTDVNRDGVPDLVGITQDVGASLSRITIVRGNPDGTLASPTSFTVQCPYFVANASCRGLALTSGDFNGDGDVDLAVALNDPRVEASAQAQDQLLVLPGLGNGEFVSGPVIPIGKGALGLTAGQVGGDSLVDIAVSSTRVMSVQAFINQSTTGDLGNGEHCAFGDECASSRCIDGVCCATTCSDGEQCNVPGREGVCQPIPGEPTTCDTSDQCESTFCVNGYCCDAACVGGRCDVEGYEGLCILGRANGETCDDDTQCASMICSSNEVCCNERCDDGFCDERGVCRPLRDLGEQCNVDQECLSSVCDVFNAICCAERCDAATEDCNSEGQCVPFNVTLTPGVQTPTPTRTQRSTPAPDGELCSVGSECQSENCVNDVCCASSECPDGQHCAEGTGQCVDGGTPTPTYTPTRIGTTPTTTRIPTEPTGNPCQPNPCPKGQKCVVDTGGGPICVATSSSSGCSTSDGGSGNLLVVAAMPLLLWAGRRLQLKRATVRASRSRR